MTGIHIKDPIVGRMAGLKFDPYEAIKPRTPVKVRVNLDLDSMEEIEKFAEEIRKDTSSPMRSAKNAIAQVVKELYTFALDKKVWTVYEVRFEEREHTDTRLTWNTYYKFFTDKKQAKVWAERVGGVFMDHRLKRIANMTDSAFKAFLIANYSGGNDELITQWREAIKEKLMKKLKKGGTDAVAKIDP